MLGDAVRRFGRPGEANPTPVGALGSVGDGGLMPLLAAAPLIVVLALMLGLRWRATYAGLAGLALAVPIAIVGFGLGVAVLPEFGLAGALAGALLEAFFTSATILWIILPALAIYELQGRSGALEALRRAVSRIADTPRDQVIFVAWFFGLFMEGVAGFGTPVALAAPLLVGLGVSPVRAVALALIGHAAGVSFGALGTPVFAQAALVPLSPAEIGRETAFVHVLAGWSLLASLIWLAGDRPPSARDWARGALAGLCFYLPFAALALLVGPELPTAGGALIGGICFAALRRRSPAAGAVAWTEVAKAAAPYAVVVLLVLITRLPTQIREALQAVELSWSIGSAFRGTFQPLYHSGGLLALGFVLGGLAQGQSGRDLIEAAVAAMRRLAPAGAALVVMLVLSRVMVHGGLIVELAAGTALAAGWWPLLAPFVGVLGTFVTGSATASNVLLTPFQSATAAALGFPMSQMAAAQGFGAAIGNMIAPHNIIAGGATVDLKGREGDILLRTASVCIACAAIGGLILFWRLA